MLWSESSDYASENVGQLLALSESESSTYLPQLNLRRDCARVHNNFCVKEYLSNCVFEMLSRQLTHVSLMVFYIQYFP